MGRITARKRITRVTVGGSVSRRDDLLAVEEPLEMRVGGSQLAVTMRTPGHDVDLAIGYLVSEGVVVRGTDVAGAIHCAGADGANTYNVLDVTLAPGVAPPHASLHRDRLTTSACGVCGKASIDAVRTRSAFAVDDDPVRIDPELVIALPGRLRAAQDVFDQTGGLHAAALFDGRTGELLVVREDVGRHNAVDKVVGWAAREGLLPLRGMVLQVSGRASFELVQKAGMAGIPVLSAVSAPSSLAVDFANEVGLTLLGFVRDPSLVAYSRPDRLVEPAATARPDASAAASRSARPDRGGRHGRATAPDRPGEPARVPAPTQPR
ncbi:formate dehydrogenase accessory sulfurtransferase FdhD [Agromyces sp. H3Y2-19a]|uniref:formate dehydrogenase accessory sulfurtransferase FdhD n=1 Tax=Agromyces chromiiresistens TaxID=3030835 RepID=UPI0023B8C27C|nr:formate dehydrogenase accessory sulfurtransferase FdhD [Agromyces chromiiresistens]MDF0512228.1 formate dehydrogenase accessory sulfurtransferase FdhD [Agromyces chromiiresistens]